MSVKPGKVPFNSFRVKVLISTRSELSEHNQSTKRLLTMKPAPKTATESSPFHTQQGHRHETTTIPIKKASKTDLMSILSACRLSVYRVAYLCTYMYLHDQNTCSLPTSSGVVQ